MARRREGWGDDKTGSAAPETLRLDRFLWQTRFFRSRALSARFVAAGRVRINARKVVRPASPVRVGDVLTFPLGPKVRVIRILALPERRGPAAEARRHYEDLAQEEARPGRGMA